MKRVQEEGTDTDSFETALKRFNGNKLTNAPFMYHVSNDTEFQTSGSINQLSAKRGYDDDEFEGD